MSITKSHVGLIHQIFPSMRGRLQGLGPQRSVLCRCPRHILRLNHFQQLGTVHRQHVRQQKDLPQTYTAFCSVAMQGWIHGVALSWQDDRIVWLQCQFLPKDKRKKGIQIAVTKMQRNLLGINAKDVFSSFLGRRSIVVFTILDISTSSAIS